jgi:hypothetical protein
VHPEFVAPHLEVEQPKKKSFGISIFSGFKNILYTASPISPNKPIIITQL